MPKSLLHAQVAFTGKLASMTHPEAYQIVREAGGTPVSSVAHSTSLLVVGMLGWPLLPDGQISRKLQRAEDLIRQGHKLRVVSEAAFLQLARLRQRQIALWKSYTAHDVCQLLKIHPQTLERWEQFSLVSSQDGLYDFRDLVSIQTIGQLVGQGVKPERIGSSLHRLANILPNIEKPLAQLKIIAENGQSILADFGQYRLSTDGQMEFCFEGSSPSDNVTSAYPADPLTALEWFEHGQLCEQEERFEEAIRAYGKALSFAPEFPEACFNLGNVLRQLGQLEEAEGLYRDAVVQDPCMVCAWYNLADVQADRGNHREAVLSLQSALHISPNYADAHFNLALMLEKLDCKQQASIHWSAYLKLAPDSPWAETARQHLQSTDLTS